MVFQPGQSGNPKGRPPKKRALTDLLERRGKQKTSSGLTAKEEFAQRVWEGLTTGKMTFGTSETAIPLEAKDYIALAKLVLGQIDGPPPAVVDVSSGGKPLETTIVLNAVPSRAERPDAGTAEDDAD
ncbi:MAG: DUF5681 domain-containing protein [Anaerolineae bacterium]|jgi:hypothetical protein|nr:DUF5681 domain-containing protein [Anaerolineae bacterium]